MTGQNILYLYMSMKKWAAVILSLTYLTLSSGFVVHQHFCMNRLVESNASAESGDKCGSCGMDKNKPGDCCKDVHKIVKVDTHQKLSEPGFGFVPFSVILPRSYRAVPFTLPASRNLPLPEIDNARLYSVLPAYIFHCVFRI